LVALQKQCNCGHKFTSEEEVEEDGEDTEEEIAIVHPDVGNEVLRRNFREGNLYPDSLLVPAEMVFDKSLVSRFWSRSCLPVSLV
jgi:hypothetical protein